MFVDLIHDIINLRENDGCVRLDFPGPEGPNSASLRTDRTGPDAFRIALTSKGRTLAAGTVSFSGVVECFCKAWAISNEQ